LRLIHTDLKPENILLVSSESIRVPDYKVVTGFLNFYTLLYCIY
jgi:serine/threonine protein kinase